MLTLSPTGQIVKLSYMCGPLAGSNEYRKVLGWKGSKGEVVKLGKSLDNCGLPSKITAEDAASMPCHFGRFWVLDGPETCEEKYEGRADVAFVCDTEFEVTLKGQRIDLTIVRPNIPD